MLELSLLISLMDLFGWFTRRTKKNVLGAQVVGPGASDLIAELSLAVNGGMNVEDIALTIHPHPTLSEPIQEAADIAIGFPTHI